MAEPFDPTMTPHEHHVRVYYEDTDFSGFVYHAAYVKFLERGRTEFLRAHGIVQSALHREPGAPAFVVSRLALAYHKPARMDDALTVTTRVDRVGGASLRLAQAVLRADTALVRAEVTVAAVRDGRAVRLPEALLHALGPAPARRPARAPLTPC